MTLHVDDAAKVLGVSPSHIRNLIKAGTLDALRLGKRVLVLRASVDALLIPPPKKVRRRK